MSLRLYIWLFFRAPYSASKHAMQALADSLRAELSDVGIKVTVISPGYVKTQISINAVTGSGKQYGRMDPNTENGLSSDDVALQIATAIANGDKDVIICTLLPRIAIYLRSLRPELFFWLMARRAKNGT